MPSFVRRVQCGGGGGLARLVSGPDTKTNTKRGAKRRPRRPPEVIGSAIAILLLTRGGVPLWGGILLSVGASFLLLLVERLGIRHLEALFAGLIGTMARGPVRVSLLCVSLSCVSVCAALRPAAAPCEPLAPRSTHAHTQTKNHNPPSKVVAFAHMYVVAGVPTAEVLRGFLVPTVRRENIGQVRCKKKLAAAGPRPPRPCL